MINILDDRSDGEIGANIGLTESIGELNIKEPMQKPKKKRYQKQDEYEGGLNSNSKTRSGILRSSGDDLENPIYDSKEDPIPKVKKIGNRGGNVMMSGESFGNPLNRSSDHNQVKRANIHREQIAEDFLEDDDIAESGEINPGMFK